MASAVEHRQKKTDKYMIGKIAERTDGQEPVCPFCILGAAGRDSSAVTDFMPVKPVKHRNTGHSSEMSVSYAELIGTNLRPESGPSE
jgi:hypothetical protein